jgi:two-component system response regulator RegA
VRGRPSGAVHNSDPLLKPVLLVDRNVEFCAELAGELRSYGWIVTTVHARQDALASFCVDRHVPVRALVAIYAATPEWLRTVKEIKAAHPHVVIVAYADFASPETVAAAIRLGAGDYIPRTTDFRVIVNAFARASSQPLYAPFATQHVPTIRELVRGHIEKVLDMHGGNITRTASVLGVPRTSLQRKLKRMLGSCQHRSPKSMT